MNSANSTSLDLEQVWAEYQQTLKAFLHSKVSNSADVDDLLQEILIKTFQNLHKVQDASSVKSWLFQLANNTIIDFYRKHARQQRDSKIDADDLWFADLDHNEEFKQNLSLCIEPFIQALPEQSAALLLAVDIKGQSQKEIAEAQNISYSTVKSRVQKSRGDLKNLFEQCCNLSLDKQGNVIDCDLKPESGCGNC
ncbi:RNA polymerase sigma factor SigZ [Vibrio chagasii]|jgi:RNA polymerase sigma-70 factor (ECF subfamily)|uniref:RNA polymerase sigma factor SigZ n=1 Tax=Vibrio TaxID=662 RepID=UPI000CF4225A|nr:MULTISPECIES: RNA polymerase sigma factor SigZ [Vibrio]MDE9383747.1 RNA polymerase sigma factor SigZ [Vibrio alginolyticus]MCG9608041.1 RNA polymerase sigma factor SigZ [Vibrio chagasii]MCG9676525.1 RNA polymerase sigma factor SigZ [Vibrio chagasii]NOI97202.1 RNA polymerase sigma factor SigZ [Vibrio sp. T3Y01]PQJ50511.1 RNA polymerase sigma factor SigZ [Vibrio splendidus]